MKNIRGWLIGGFVVGGWWLPLSIAFAADAGYAAQVRAAETKYKTPEDLLDVVPFLGEIPRSFLLGDGYQMKLSVDQLRIDHMGRHSRSRGAKRTCMIGVSYTTPVAGFFTSRIDLPIFHSPTLAWSDWSVSSLGDYVVYMSRIPAERSSIRLAISARF